MTDIDWTFFWLLTALCGVVVLGSLASEANVLANVGVGICVGFAGYLAGVGR